MVKAINGINIREANVNDVDEIVKVAESVFPHEYKGKNTISKEYFKDIISSSFNGLYVAQKGDVLLGYAFYIPLVLVGTSELVQIGVKKEERGGGIGTFLLSKSLKKYIEKLKVKGIGVYSVFLTTSKDNPVGQRLYKKVGFKETGEMRDTFVGLGNIEIIMTHIVDKSKVYPKDELWEKEKKD